MTGLLARLSLRTRLLASLIVVLVMGLLVTGVATVGLLRDYLNGRVDDELVAATDAVVRRPAMGRFESFGRRPGLPSRYQLSILDADGSSLVERRGTVASGPGPDLSGVTTSVGTQRAGEPYTVDADDGTPYRVLLTPLGSGQTLALSTSLEDVTSTTRRLGAVMLAVDLLVLLGLVALAYAMVRASLQPLRRIEQTAGAIAGGDLSQRVPETAGPGTEVGRLSRSLNGMLGQIERAFAARAASEARMRRFVADASHELRTPLTSIRGFAELYRQGAVRDDLEVDRLMRRIEGESRRMGGLVDDLLLLARLDERRPLRRQAVDLAALAADAVHDARPTAGGHDVRLETPGGGAVPVTGDEERLRQVLGNLLGNAVRHTPRGTTVTVRALRREGAGVLEVSDDGPGLSPEQAARVFDRFYRADSGRGRTTGGSGLGLAIVHALVEAQGGRVEVETAPGQGACFRVVLPEIPLPETGGQR
jgi:two-component system OmpR family sensor kinase